MTPARDTLASTLASRLIAVEVMHRALAPSKWTVLALVGVGVLMCTLDTSIVNVSLPAIAHYFGVPLGAEVEWVIIAYLVVIAALLLTIGRLADIIGRKRIWVSGLIAFTIGSALCGASPALWFLILARALQGIGGAMLMAISPAMLTAAFPANERGRALGLNSTVVALGVSAGPSIGGILTERFSWRWIFYINVPIGIIGAIAAGRLLVHERRPDRVKLDLVGASLLATALASLTIALSLGNEVGWSSPVILVLGVLAVVTCVVFVRRELRCDAPLLDISLLRDRLFASANVSLVLSFLAIFAVAFLLPFYFEQARHFAPEKTGLLMTPFPLMVACVAPISGHLADRIGTRWLAAAGMLIVSFGLVLLSRLDARSSLAAIIGFQVVTALGSGLFQSPNNSALMGAAPRDRQGVAAGMLATGRVVGQCMSVAIAGAVFGTLGAATAGRALLDRPGDPALEATFTRGFSWALLTCAAIALIAVASSLMRGTERRAVAP